LSHSLRWLLHSGIQNPEGGVSRYYLSDRRQYKAVSHEITGYHAGTLAWLYTMEHKPEALAGAIKTADFLVEHAWNASLRTFPFERADEHADPSPAYFFDCGIIVRGLLAVWRITRTPRYWEVAKACAEQMLIDFDSGFDFHPVLDLPGKTPALRDVRWSRSSGCYQLKSALAWYEVSHVEQNPALDAAWQRARDQSVKEHEQFLPGHTEEERVMDRLHAYCYFLEALIATPAFGGRDRALAVGIQRVSHLLHKIESVFTRTDVCAQLLRVRLYANAAGILPLDTHTAALEAEQIASLQLHSDDPRIDGGFCFGRKAGQLLPFVNPVSTDFAIQACHLWHLHQANLPLPPASGLV
jgi:hypothetical protein